MKIGIYKSHSKTPRNMGWVVCYAFDKDWEENVLRQRCLLGNRVFHREAFPHEVEEREHNWRAVSYKYDNIESLLADERRAGCDEETIEKIRTALEG